MNRKNSSRENFDPNVPGISGSLFGLPFSPENSSIVILPVPWEVTVSYAGGTSRGPLSVLDASSQVDLEVFDITDAWKMGVSMLAIDESLYAQNEKYRELAKKHIDRLEGKTSQSESQAVQQLDSINKSCQGMVDFVEKVTGSWLDKGKVVGVLGGDHSCPLGLLTSLSKRVPSFGILQIDAHADLREAYEDFQFSHASIMYNALKIKNISKLIQVGVRDFCKTENDYINSSNGRIKTFFQPEIEDKLFRGILYSTLVDEIVNELPENVYISFDIDGLDPSLCPNTGTPVPGGLSFDQARYLIKELVKSGRKIVGFDLCEVAPSSVGDQDWDANVGARVLYNLINFTGISQGYLSFRV